MTPWVTRLLIANVALFALQSFLPPLLVEYLVFVPVYVFSRPWTIITYMFLHGGLSHILFNMLGLFFFGSRVESRLGERRFISLYLISGVFGALASLVFTPRAAVIGASAGVFGVMLAFAWFWPREKIYIWGVIPVEARLRLRRRRWQCRPLCAPRRLYRRLDIPLGDRTQHGAASLSAAHECRRARHGTSRGHAAQGAAQSRRRARPHA
jgi:Rhomboid family